MFLLFLLCIGDIYNIDELHGTAIIDQCSAHGKTYLYFGETAFKQHIYIYDWANNKRENTEDFVKVPKDQRVNLVMTGSLLQTAEGIAIASFASERFYYLDKDGHFLDSKRFQDDFPKGAKVRWFSSKDGMILVTYILGDQTLAATYDLETKTLNPVLNTSGKNAIFLLFKDNIICLKGRDREITLYDDEYQHINAYSIDGPHINEKSLFHQLDAADERLTLGFPLIVDDRPMFTLIRSTKNNGKRLRERVAIELKDKGLAHKKIKLIAVSPSKKKAIYRHFEKEEFFIDDYQND